MAANLYRRLSAGWHRGHAASPQEALRREPAVNPTLLGAVQVPDGTIDLVSPHRGQYARRPRTRRARIPTGCEVTGLLRRGDRALRRVQVYDRQLHQARTLYAGMVVNAAGIWGSVRGICRPAHHHVPGEGIGC
ncbi:FAD-dependent oxidoreductase [Klebsiella pneumoniae subsp. pneumoniae]|nr:FAD-dependent oxidoreductase [Klebsiella pneumoniae subsp. pneumoniae]